jgi:hypothetical protein
MALMGCGGAVSSSTSGEEATVHGIVKVRGKRATSGAVTFDPGSGTPKSAPIGKDGAYTVKAQVGHNTVLLTGPGVPNESTAQRMIPACDVASGDNTFDIEFPPLGK